MTKTEYDKNHYKKNKERIDKQHKKYRESNRKALKEHRRRQRLFLLNFLGGKCLGCGTKDERVLQFDHIRGDGADDRRRINNKCGTIIPYYAHHLDEAKQNLQILCANCNIIKAREMGEYSPPKGLNK